MTEKKDSIQNPEENKDLKDVVIEEGKVTLSEEKYRELVEQKANLTQDKTNLVNEIQELRSKKQLTEQERDELAGKINELQQTTNTTTDPNQKVNVEELARKVVFEHFTQKAKEDREVAKEKAMLRFIKDNPDFAKENDEAGLKMSALSRKLERFNLDSLNTEDEFVDVFNDALKLVGKKETIDDTINQIPSNPQTIHTPPTTDNVVITSQEQKVIDIYLGGDKDKFLQQKAKRPEYISELMRYVN